MRIDPHVHFRDEEQSYKETISHGLKVAKDQGVDIVFDMPNTAKPIITPEDVMRRLTFVPKEEYARYFLYIGATKNPEQLKKAALLVKENEKVIGIKMFAGKSTGNLEILSEDDQKSVYKTLADADYDGVLAVHCEKESLMSNNFDPKNPISHSISRPKEAEIASVQDQINFAESAGFKGNLHICHASCSETVELIADANKRGKIKATCGVTPHHLLWDNTRMDGEHGLLYKMNPPLRNPSDVKALVECLKEGKVNWIETDHAPHAIGEKMFSGYPSGYPSLYLYKRFVEEFLPSLGLSDEQIKALTFDNIKKAFKLNL
jgi:dihydroorotase